MFCSISEYEFKPIAPAPYSTIAALGTGRTPPVRSAETRTHYYNKNEFTFYMSTSY